MTCFNVIFKNSPSIDVADKLALLETFDMISDRPLIHPEHGPGFYFIFSIFVTENIDHEESYTNLARSLWVSQDM